MSKILKNITWVREAIQLRLNHTDIDGVLAESIELVDELFLKDRGKTNEINLLAEENRQQAARIASLEAQLAAATERERILINTMQGIRDEFDRSTNSDSVLLRGIIRKVDNALAAAQPASDGGEEA